MTDKVKYQEKRRINTEKITRRVLANSHIVLQTMSRPNTHCNNIWTRTDPRSSRTVSFRQLSFLLMMSA